MITFLLAALAGATGSQSAPSAPVAAKHPYRPASVTSRSVYVCEEGQNSVTVRYDAVGKARLTEMTRGGKRARQSVLDTLNSELERFTFVSGLQYQCGYGGDSVYVTGTIGAEKSTAWLHWSLVEGQIVSSARSAESSN